MKTRDAIQADAVRFIDRNTLVIYDPTDICKPHSYKMEKLSLVRDASRSSRATSRDGGSRRRSAS